MISFLGKCTQNLIKCLKYILTGQLKFSAVLEQASTISYDSLPISLIISFIAAAVITIQVAKQFLMSGAEAYIGGTIAVVMLREIAPGFVALAIGARAGTAISAEIANMQVTEQVDAIKTLKLLHPLIKSIEPLPVCFYKFLFVICTKMQCIGYTFHQNIRRTA